MKKVYIKISLCLVTFSLLLTPVLGAKKAPGKVNLKGFSRFVDTMLPEWDVPGAAVAIVKDGKVIFADGFGYRNVEKKLEVTTDTLFAIGSCTKAFTATILGILVDEGKLEWDWPVRNYLPSFTLRDSVASQQMTPVDLLSHRSGLPRHDTAWYGSPVSRKDLFNRLRYFEPSKGFRSTYQYNNLMFMTAGYLAGKIAGTTWEQLVRTKLFAPLGMKSSNFSVKDSQKSVNFSLPYSKRDDKITAVPFRNLDTIGPAGSINSSAADIAQWLLLNLNKGKVGDTQVISEGNLLQIHTPQMVTGEGLPGDKELFYSSYGMGWRISAYRGHPTVSHGGSIDGFVAYVSFLPRDHAGVVILTNSDVGGALCAVIAYNVFDRILELRQIPWSHRFKTRAAKADTDRKAAEEKKDKDRKLNTHPSHDLKDYAGTYENPGYGMMTVEQSDGKLTASLNDLRFEVDHYHYDMFELSTEAMGGQKVRATFHTDARGNIGSLTVPLQPGVDDIEFKRLPEKKDKEFLQKMVGEYEFSGGIMKISLKGDQNLVLTIPGQPPHDLVFYKETEFNFKAFRGFSVKFVLNESGNVIALEYPRADGVLTAKKLK